MNSKFSYDEIFGNLENEALIVENVYLSLISLCDIIGINIFLLQAEEYVPLPKGDVHKKKEIVQDVTLHDLDVANARPQVKYNVSMHYCVKKITDKVRVDRIQSGSDPEVLVLVRIGLPFTRGTDPILFVSRTPSVSLLQAFYEIELLHSS